MLKNPKLILIRGIEPPLPWETPSTEPPPPVDYMTMMATHPNRVSAIRFNSQESINLTSPRQKPYDPVTQKKRPFVYDPILNAARADFHPIETTDCQQLWPKLGIKAGESAYFSFDLRMSSEMAQRTATDWNRHKAQQLDGPGGSAWLTIRTFYDAARQQNIVAGDSSWRIAYWVMTANSATSTVPQRTSSTEYVEPRQNFFYVRANTWSRIHMYFEDICSTLEHPLTSETQRTKFPNGRVMKVSYWQSDENRPAVQILNESLVLQPYTEINLLRFEWDTGTDTVPGDDRYSSIWQRNVVSIRNPDKAEIPGFLIQPTPLG